VDALRAGGFARLSVIAEDEGGIAGHVLYSELEIRTPHGIVDALALAPLAVLPERQRQGIGSELVQESLHVLRQSRHRIVIVLGHPHFYPRFGFSPALARPLASPYAGPHLMALELVPGALRGVRGEVHYPPPFQAPARPDA